MLINQFAKAFPSSPPVQMCGLSLKTVSVTFSFMLSPAMRQYCGGVATTGSALSQWINDRPYEVEVLRSALSRYVSVRLLLFRCLTPCSTRAISCDAGFLPVSGAHSQPYPLGTPSTPTLWRAKWQICPILK